MTWIIYEFPVNQKPRQTLLMAMSTRKRRFTSVFLFQLGRTGKRLWIIPYMYIYISMNVEGAQCFKFNLLR